MWYRITSRRIKDISFQKIRMSNIFNFRMFHMIRVWMSRCVYIRTDQLWQALHNVMLIISDFFLGLCFFLPSHHDSSNRERARHPLGRNLPSMYLFYLLFIVTGIQYWKLMLSWGLAEKDTKNIIILPSAWQKKPRTSLQSWNLHFGSGSLVATQFLPTLLTGKQKQRMKLL